MPTEQDVINTILGEAGNSQQGMTAVAHVIANRAAQRGLTPAQVVAQPHQFEAYSNPSPGGVANQQNPALRAQAQAIWNAVQSGQSPDPTAGGTQYYGNYAAPPDWARGAVSTGQTAGIGGNVFLLGSGTMPPMNIPTVGSQYADTSAPTPMAPRSDAAQQSITNPDGSVNWGAFYQGLTPATPLATGPSASPVNGDFSALAMQGQNPDLAAALAARAAPITDAASAANFYQGFGLAPAPANGSTALSNFLTSVGQPATIGAPPVTTPVHSIAVGADGQPVTGVAPGYNSTTEAQRNALLALPSASSSAGIAGALAAGPVYTGQGIAGTAQLPAGWHPAAGTVPSIDSVPTPTTTPALSGAAAPSSATSWATPDVAQSWTKLINSFNADPGSYADGSVNNSKDQSQLAAGTGLGFSPAPLNDPNSVVAPTTRQVTTQQLNPAYSAWLKDQNSAIYGVQGVDSPSLDANGNVVLPSSYLGAAPAVPAPPKYISVAKTITVPGKPASAAPLGIAAAAPPVAQPIAATDGFLFQPNGSGGYTSIGAVPGVDPTALYNDEAAKAYASAGVANPDMNYGFNLLTGSVGPVLASSGGWSGNSGGSLSGGDGSGGRQAGQRNM